MNFLFTLNRIQEKNFHDMVFFNRIVQATNQASKQLKVFLTSIFPPHDFKTITLYSMYWYRHCYLILFELNEAFISNELAMTAQ